MSTLAIINHVLDMGKWLRRAEAGKLKMPEQGIHAKPEKELEDCMWEATINPLIGMASMCLIGSSHAQDNNIQFRS